MKENEFTSQRTGKLAWVEKGMYYRFEPAELPFQIEITPAIEKQAQKAAVALGRLDGITKKFKPNEIEVFQTPFILKEAALSSEIEGTRSTITDIYKEEKIREQDPERRKDNEEVRNYRDTLAWALKENPPTLDEEFIKGMHQRLLKGVRGSDKNPGEYKTYQNAIGKRDDNLDIAKFVPASPETTLKLMQNFVEFLHTDRASPLTKIAVAHYQFEAIHPFRDGNGKIGRLLIMLQLCREGFLTRPLLYISEYINRNRDTYLDALYFASAQGKIEEFILFILIALEVQANRSIELLTKIENYKEELQEKIKRMTKSHNMHELINYIFTQPIFSVRDVKDILNISQSGAWQLVQKLKREGIVLEANLDKKSNIYIAAKLLDILEGKA